MKADFYIKTFHHHNYPGAKLNYDSMWCSNPEPTAEFMKGVQKPWIAFKVLAAKTGYLPEVGNNLLVKLQSKSNSKAKIIVVLMGAATRNATTLDASKLGSWATPR